MEPPPLPQLWPLPTSCQHVLCLFSHLRAPHRQRVYPRELGEPGLRRKQKGMGPLCWVGSGQHANM